jgi:chemotaxis protein methyltransferase CheR
MTSPIALMPQDVVFLRNVLIYFREEEQGQIIQKIAECLNPGSLLILGESECLTASNSLFTFVKPQIYRRTA